MERITAKTKCKAIFSLLFILIIAMGCDKNGIISPETVSVPALNQDIIQDNGLKILISLLG